MNFKRVVSLFMLFLLTVQFQFYGCEDKKAKETSVMAPVNDPKNDYQILMTVVSFGGVAGCSAGFVSRGEEPISDAKVKINSVTFPNDTSSFVPNFYADTLGLLDLRAGTQYTLHVEHQNKEIATGKAIMPTPPHIVNLSDGYNHPLNSKLTIKWEKSEHATSIEVLISTTVYDPVTKDSLDREFDSGLLDPSTTSIVVPDTFFSYPGQYVLGIIAYHGLNPNVRLEGLLDENGQYSKSYNLEGAAGLFYAAMIVPDYNGQKINVVDNENGKASTLPKAIANRTLEQTVIQTFRKRGLQLLKQPWK